MLLNKLRGIIESLGKYSIHPELLDKSGKITDEELLTVRFSNDSDSTLEKGTTPD